MRDGNFDRRRRERGFALVLAILSLMLLTFLGLTMAATTSTELQIATNYRWSQQALYNAEAGLEAARVVLSNAANVTSQWNGVLPAVRAGTWAPGSAPAHGTATGRDYDRDDCDDRGGIGYGLVLVGNDGTRYENTSEFAGQTLNGAFTTWVRRPLNVDNQGLYSDDTRNDTLILVAEGVAPYIGGFAGEASALLRSRQAVRVLETRYALGLATTGDPCGLGRLQGQEGGSPMGENFNPCVNVTSGRAGSLSNVFGGTTDASLGSFTDVQ
jgi:PilX N-terminal